MKIKRRVAALLCGALTLSTLAVLPVANADDAGATRDIRQYQVAFTGGIGVRLRTAPSVDAPGYPTPTGDLALPEGAWFPAECEEYGDWVTNIYGETTNIYMRAPGGPMVSTAWLYTGTNERVGLPLCSEKDAALHASLKPPTVGDAHRSGTDVVTVTNPEQTSGRSYFSIAKTREAAEALNHASNAYFWGNTLFCATLGGLTGVATGGLGLAVSSGIGVSGDVLCSVLAGVSEPAGFQHARGAANAAASAGKCYEVRMHKDPATQEWVSDMWTVTDHVDYCG